MTWVKKNLSGLWRNQKRKSNDVKDKGDKMKIKTPVDKDELNNYFKKQTVDKVVDLCKEMMKQLDKKYMDNEIELRKELKDLRTKLDKINEMSK